MFREIIPQYSNSFFLHDQFIFFYLWQPFNHQLNELPFCASRKFSQEQYPYLIRFLGVDALNSHNQAFHQIINYMHSS